MKTTRTKPRMCIVGNGPYGLYYGEVRATDAEVLKVRAVRVYNCRTIRYWYGGHGGITSLAAWGPCGPNVAKNRIGAAAPSSLLTDVKALHECSPEAIVAFASIVPTR